VPVGGGLLYVEPVYVQATGGTSYPLLRRVLVSFGDQIAFEDTLDEALDVLFGGDSGADAGDQGTPGDTDGEGSDPGTTPPADGGTTDPGTDGGTGGTDTSGNPELAQALDDARQALEDRQAAYAEGDLVAAAEADERLQEALQRALAADS